MSAAELISVGRDGHPVLEVVVQPGASRTGVVGRHGDALKVRVTAPPEAGRANRSVQDLLADVLGIPVATVELVSGASHRRKRFRLVGLAAEELARRLQHLLAD